MKLDPSIWRGRRVLVTGHTGFKGAWLSLWLERLGAEVIGLSLPPQGCDCAFNRFEPSSIDSRLGDIRDASEVHTIIGELQPSVVMHLAAEAIVRRAFDDPVATFETNVMGTINVLEAIRAAGNVEAALMITSDKVYSDASHQPASEGDRLGGSDPYSSSKACVELVVHTWRQSYFEPGNPRVGSARAGNVIGGGDTSPYRLVPDLLRAAMEHQPVRLRNPRSIRPWQHVLDPLHGYLLFVQSLLHDPTTTPPALNFGPEDLHWTVEDVAHHLQMRLGGTGVEVETGTGPTEAPALLLDSTLAKRALGWRPRLTTEQALDWTADWYETEQTGGNLRELGIHQVEMFEGRANALPERC